MRTLIIPDVHDKITAARRIVDRVPHDRLIFLGDFFDDFPTGVDDARATAQFVKEMLDSGAELLMGNHDLSYGWGRSDRRYRCSGYAADKCTAIHEVLGPDDWAKFKLHAWIEGSRRPWLVTHAGIDYRFVFALIEEDRGIVEVVDHLCAAALATLGAPTMRVHSLLSAGYDRGGSNAKGGLVWCDWRSLSLPPGIDQLVGHTPGRAPRVEDCMDAIGVCIDTHLRHYAVVEDGTMQVEEVARL